MTAGPLGNVDSSEVDSSDTPAMKGYEACMAKVGNVLPSLRVLPARLGPRRRSHKQRRQHFLSRAALPTPTSAASTSCSSVEYHISALHPLHHLFPPLRRCARRAHRPAPPHAPPHVPSSSIRRRGKKTNIPLFRVPGYRRNQMRAKFNIPGDEYEDYLYWRAACSAPPFLSWVVVSAL